MGPYLSQLLLKNSGAQNKSSVFLLSESQLKEDAFLEDVDSLLNSGEVPNLFNSEEVVGIGEVRKG